MSEIVLPVVSGVIGALTGSIGAYVIANRMLNTNSLMLKIEEITDQVLTNENLQKKIYTVGAIVGKGITDGTGIINRIPKGGKSGGLMGTIIQGLMSRYMPNLGGEEQQQQPQPQANTNTRAGF